MTRLGRAGTTLVCWVLAALFLAGAALADEDLVQNGDAEQGTVGQAPPSWNPVGEDGKNDFPLKTVPNGRSGTKAIMIDRPAGYEPVRIQQSVSIELAEPGHYRYSVWLRGDRPMSASADQFIDTVVPAGAGFIHGTRQRFLDVGTEWTLYSLDFYTPAALDADGKPYSIQAKLCVQLRKDGPLYIDEVSFGRVSISAELKARIEYLGKILNPPGVVQAPYQVVGAIVTGPDDTLLAFKGDYTLRRSTDGGSTWGAQEKLAIDDPFDRLSGAIRMRNGDIGIWSLGGRKPLYFWRSADDGKTWSRRIPMGPEGERQHGGPCHGRAMIETQAGRLVIGVRDSMNAHAGIYEPGGAYGTLNGKRIKVEGHGHDPEMDLAFAYYSDDGGRTWKRSECHIMIWKDGGLGGIWPCDEPKVAQLKDGRLLMFVRTTLGRIYQCFSTDGGRRWSQPEPTALPSCYSPCSLEAVPANEYTVKSGRAGDLLCVWNNVSREEVRRGRRRARLSSAVSRDDGKTWEHVRTLAAIGVPPLDEMAQLDPPAMTRAEREIGELPMPFGTASYPDVTVDGDSVLVQYYMSFRKPSMSAGGRLHIRPLAWFYGED